MREGLSGTVANEHVQKHRKVSSESTLSNRKKFRYGHESKTVFRANLGKILFLFCDSSEFVLTEARRAGKLILVPDSPGLPSANQWQ